VPIGENDKSPVSGITFDNVTIIGKRLVPDDPRTKKNQSVTGVKGPVKHGTAATLRGSSLLYAPWQAQS